MAWIESHQTLGNHPKLLKLASILECKRATAVGYLHYLWWWAIDYAPDGNVTRYVTSDAVIADVIHFHREYDAADDDMDLVAILIETGWLDRSESGEVSIHDWDAYSNRLVAMRKANAERQKRFREAQKKAVTRYVTPTVTLHNGATVHNTTQHNTTEPEKKSSGAVAPCPPPYSAPEDSAPELPGVTAAFPEVTKEKYHPHARTALHFLNDASGSAFREVDSNLSLITARLKEVGVDIEGVKQMITRQVALWKGDSKMDSCLRPETLFGKTKFDGYYGAKAKAIPNAPADKPTHRNRNAGTMNVPSDYNSASLARAMAKKLPPIGQQPTTTPL